MASGLAKGAANTTLDARMGNFLSAYMSGSLKKLDRLQLERPDAMLPVFLVKDCSSQRTLMLSLAITSCRPRNQKR